MVVCSSVRTIVASPGCLAGSPGLYRSISRKGRAGDGSADDLRGVVAHHRLHLEALFAAELAPFAAVAGLLVAAERRAEIGPGAIQVDIAGAQLRRHFPRVLEIARGHIAGEAVDRVVGQAD